jgi:hypothetical protein
MWGLGSKETAGREYAFTMVISPNGKSGERVYEMSGTFVLEQGDTIADAQKSIAARSGHMGRRGFVVSFDYH